MGRGIVRRFGGKDYALSYERALLAFGYPGVLGGWSLAALMGLWDRPWAFVAVAAGTLAATAFGGWLYCLRTGWLFLRWESEPLAGGGARTLAYSAKDGLGTVVGMVDADGRHYRIA